MKESCIVCGLPLEKLDPKGSFLLCNGSEEQPHPNYLLSLRFISRNETHHSGEIQADNGTVKEEETKSI